MKKYFLAFALLLTSFVSFAEVQSFLFVPLEVRLIDPTYPPKPRPKAPIMVPEVSLIDHTLYIYDVAYDLTLALVDEDDEVIYTVFVPANTSSVVLPSWLEGDYQLLFIPDEDYYFAGEISL